MNTQVSDKSKIPDNFSGKLLIKKQEIICEDCIQGMRKLENESVDIVICDPPYNIGKDFGNNSDKQEMMKYLEMV